METRFSKHRHSGKGIKERFNRWISKSPKLEKFVDEAGYYIKHPDKFSEMINEVYNKATEAQAQTQRTLGEYVEKIKACYRMITMTLTGEYKGLSKMQVYMGFGAVIYLVSPIDLIPDALPFLGFVDDIALLYWVIKHASEETEKFEQWEKYHNFSPVK